MTRFARLCLLALAAALLVGSTPAWAVPTLKLTSGVTTIFVDDNGLFDANPAVGEVTFIGAVGAWTTNISTGLSDPTLPGPYPHMDTNSVTRAAAGAPALTISFSDTGFGPFSGSLLGDIGGTLSGSGSPRIRYQVYVDYGNTAFALTTLVLDSGLLGPGPFSGTDSGAVNALGLFSVTQVITISSGGLASFDAEVQPVPEPGTMLLIGSGVSALVLRRRRKA